jgi:predicted nucleotidyltransferase
MLEKVKEILPEDYELIYLTQFGSTLYGTNKEGKSDIDLKGIYLPSIKDLITNKTKDHFRYSSGDDKSKNSCNDIDIELWSIHKFLKHLSDGDTGAIDVFFSMWREDTIIFKLSVIDYLKSSKYIFLTRNIKAFVGYTMGQAQKYGIKGSRYGDLLKLSEIYDRWRSAQLPDNKDKKNGKISIFYTQCKDIIEKLKYCKFIEQDGKTYLSVLGKMHEDSVSIPHFEKQLDSQINAYGDRTKASINGTDWKALSHAYRVIYQVAELLETGFIKYPLSSAKKIMEVKYNTDESKLSNILDDIADKLDYVYKLVGQSEYPEKVDQAKVDKIILGVYHDRYSLL